jgi:hypothetical protein
MPHASEKQTNHQGLGHQPNLIRLVCLICASLFVLAACRTKDRWAGQTLQVDYVWDSEFHILHVQDSAGKDIDDHNLNAKILQEAKLVLPRWIQVEKLSHARGTFHIKFYSGGATEILEAKLGPDSYGSGFIQDPEVTPLMLRAHAGDLDRVREILDKSDNVNATDQRGNTALMSAIGSHSVEVLRLLLSHGANLKMYNREGETALTLSVFSGQPEMIRELAGHGAVLNCNDAVEREAYLGAYRRKDAHADVIRYLRKISVNCGTVQKSVN